MGPRRNLILAGFVAVVGYAGIVLMGGLPTPVPVPWPDGTIWAPGPGVAPSPTFDPADQSIEAAMRAQALSEDVLFSIASVIGTGVGWTADGRVALRVFVEPGAVSMIPSRLAGFPVVISEAGPFYAGAPAPVSAEADEADLLPTSRYERPVPMGISTGHLNSTAGTIGAVVTDGVDTYALSNWHVFVPAGKAKVGRPAASAGTIRWRGQPFRRDRHDWRRSNPIVLSIPSPATRSTRRLRRPDQVSPFTPVQRLRDGAQSRP